MGMAVFHGALHLLSMALCSLGLNWPYKRRSSQIISLGSLVVWYIHVPTPTPVILLYAYGTERFNLLITAAFTFSFDSYTLILKLYCTSASAWPAVLKAGSTTRCGPGSGHTTHAVGHQRAYMVGSSTMPPYPLSIDWYDGTVLNFFNKILLEFV